MAVPVALCGQTGAVGAGGRFADLLCSASWAGGSSIPGQKQMQGDRTALAFATKYINTTVKLLVTGDVEPTRTAVGHEANPPVRKPEVAGGYTRPVLARSLPAQWPAPSCAPSLQHCANRSKGMRSVHVIKSAKQQGTPLSTSVAPCRWRRATLRDTSPHPVRKSIPVVAASTRVPPLGATCQNSKATV